MPVSDEDLEWAALIALSSALLKKSVRGGLVVAVEVTFGGTIEPIHNAVTLAEIAVEKGAKSLLLPVSCRRQLFDLGMRASLKGTGLSFCSCMLESWATRRRAMYIW